MADNDNERTVVSFGEISSDDSESEVKSPCVIKSHDSDGEVESPFVKTSEENVIINDATLDSSTPKNSSGGLSLDYLVPVEDIKTKDPCEEPPIANKNVENTSFVQYISYLVPVKDIKIKDACEEPPIAYIPRVVSSTTTNLPETVHVEKDFPSNANIPDHQD